MSTWKKFALVWRRHWAVGLAKNLDDVGVN